MSLPANVIALRNLLAKRFPEAQAAAPEATPAPKTGIACLDAAGWVKGSLLEVVGEKAGCGVGLLLAALLEGAGQEAVQPLALIDGADAFDPTSISSAALERVLWVRCHEPEQAVRVADLLLRDGNLSRVLLDLQLHPLRALRRIPAHAWHRLRMLGEKSGVSLCIFTPEALVPCAKSRLVMDEQFSLEALDADRATLLGRLRGRVVRGGAGKLERDEQHRKAG